MIKPWNMTDRELILAGLDAGGLEHELALRLERAHDEIISLTAEIEAAQTKIDELIGELLDAQEDLAETQRKTQKRVK